MKKTSLILGCFLSILLVCSAWAVPTGISWNRGDDGTTWQDWTFDTEAPDPTAIVPDAYDNEAGDPTANVVAIGAVHGSEPGWYDQFLGRQGVWHGAQTDITLTIPNFPNANLYKEIWAVVNFRGDLVEQSVTVTGAAVTELDSNIDNEPDGWRMLTIGWRIEPNPESEEIYLSFVNSGADINYVIVDTICIPEPATISLLGLAGAGLVLLRKRNGK